MSATTKSAIISVLLPLLWSALHVSCWINPRFLLVLQSLERISELFEIVGLEFCAGLLPVLHASTPPSIDWFLGLPSTDSTDKKWGIYIIVLRKPGHRYKLYIGSATAYYRGVRARFEEYDNSKTLPRYVKAALKDGYTIQKKTLLAECPIPEAGNVPVYRVVLLALEAIFACYFWAMSKRDHDYGFNHLCPWSLDSFNYDGACSHNPLKEGFEGELGLTKEELQKIADDIKAKNIAYGRAYHKQQRVDATPKFKAAQRKANKKARPRTQRLRIEAREKKTFYCDVCDYAGGDAGKLKDHKQTKRHIRRVKERSAK